MVIPEDVASLSEHEAKELLVQASKNVLDACLCMMPLQPLPVPERFFTHVQAKAEIKSLKEHVAEETRRKKYAAEVLLAVGNGHQQYMANESSQ